LEIWYKAHPLLDPGAESTTPWAGASG